MTCIIGLVEGNTVYMGGDTLASDMVGSHVVTRKDDKVFFNEEFLIGFCGSYRVGQLLRYAFVPPDVPSKKEDMAYMVTDFIDAWRAVQKEKGSLKKADEEESHPSSFIVGWRGRLYVVEEDFDVGQPADEYYAVGGGAQLAFGSLHSTRDMQLSPTQRIVMALDAAAAYNASVRAPYTILQFTHKGSE